MKIYPTLLALAAATAIALTTLAPRVDAQLNPKAPPAKPAVEVDARLKKIFDGEKMHYDITGAGVFRLVFNIGAAAEKRSQVVFVNSQTETYGEFEIREVWSIARRTPEKTLDAAFYRRLLEDSQAKKLGGWSLLSADGQDYIIYSVKVAADLNPKALKDVLEVVLETADELEKKETGGQDDF